MTAPAESPSEILARYAEGPAQLESALSGLTDADLDLAPAADSWSIRQIVHHLADGDDIWKICIKAALGNSDGLFTLQWYWDQPQMEWADSWKYASRDIESSLALLRASRRHIVELMQQIPEAWEQSIRLKRPDGQEVRVAVGWVIEMQARHVVDHVRDILSILRAHRA